MTKEERDEIQLFFDRILVGERPEDVEERINIYAKKLLSALEDAEEVSMAAVRWCANLEAERDLLAEKNRILSKKCLCGTCADLVSCGTSSYEVK